MVQERLIDEPQVQFKYKHGYKYHDDGDQLTGLKEASAVINAGTSTDAYVGTQSSYGQDKEDFLERRISIGVTREDAALAVSTCEQCPVDTSDAIPEAAAVLCGAAEVYE